MLMDYSTWYPEAIPNIEENTVTEALIHVLCHEGFLAKAIMDLGSSFMSLLM